MMFNILQIFFIISALTECQANIITLENSQVTLDPASLKELGKIQYYFGEEKVSWYEALSKCRSAGGLLASLEGKSEAKLLFNHLLKNYYSNNNWWLSGADLHKKGDFYWYGTGKAVSYNNWYNGQPNNQLNNENCVLLSYTHTDYHMNRMSCNMTSRYICEFRKHEKVEKGPGLKTISFEKVGDKYYYFAITDHSWYKAFLDCRSIGGFLASITGPEEMQALSEHLTNKYPMAVYWWLSAADFYRYDKFDWYGTGKAMVYNKWSAAYLDNLDEIENCVHLWLDGSEYKMEAFPCNKKSYFICESKKPQAIVPISSGLDFLTVEKSIDETANCVTLWLDGTEWKTETIACKKKSYSICKSNEHKATVTLGVTQDFLNEDQKDFIARRDIETISLICKKEK